MRKLLALLIIALAAFIFVKASGKDETISGYATPGVTWTLSELGGAPYPTRATLTFPPEEGQIAGKAPPCNSYSATQSAPYPWFEAGGPVAATKRACPDLPAETAFFDALARVTLAEVAGEVLILSTEDGFEMVFQAR